MLTTQMIETRAVESSVPDEAARVEALAALSEFRSDFYGCLTGYGDTLFELTDVLLCVEGRVTSPAELSLAREHRRGRGSLYKALNRGTIDIVRFRAT